MKRYTRAEDAAPADGPRWPQRQSATDRAAVMAAYPGHAGANRRTAGCARPIPPPRTAIAIRSGESIQSRARAMQRGTLVHRLLQSLPDIAAERRREAALRYLARNADDWTEAERETLAAKMLALIADPRFAPVFAPGSRAEVSIAGRLERPGTAARAGFRANRPAGGHRSARS